MIIDTIFNKGDTVWIMNNNYPQQGKIIGIRIDLLFGQYGGRTQGFKDDPTKEMGINFELDVKNVRVDIMAKKCFKTKELLLNSFK